MNKRQQTIIECLKNLDSSFHYRENIIKLNRHNTDHHELAKFLVCLEIMNNGGSVVTEAIFTNGKRADIYVLSKNYCIEIVNSETQASIEKKKDEYPVPIIFLKASDVIKENLKWVNN